MPNSPSREWFTLRKMLSTRIRTISDSLINIDLSICASFSAEAQNGTDGLVRSLAKAPRSFFLRGAAERRRTAARRASEAHDQGKGQRSRPVSKATLRDFVTNRANCALSLLQRVPHAVLREGLRPGEGGKERRRMARASVSRSRRVAFRSNRVIVLFLCVCIGRSAVRTIDARRTDTASLVARRS